MNKTCLVWMIWGMHGCDILGQKKPLKVFMVNNLFNEYNFAYLVWMNGWMTRRLQTLTFARTREH